MIKEIIVEDDNKCDDKGRRRMLREHRIGSCQLQDSEKNYRRRRIHWTFAECING